jgi:glycosyltransferase involved in cell wall biosynthesis
MKVALVNNQLQLGGAETVMHQLHNGLIQQGHESRLHVAEGKTYPPGVAPLYPRLLSRLDHSRLHSLTNRFFPRFAWTDRSFRSLAEGDADVVSLHNFHGNYASIESLAHVAARKKLVWTFHALWGVTGGCDHPRDCQRYQAQCGACPQIGQWAVGPVDHTAQQLQEKLDRLSGLPLHIVAPSRWLADIVRASQVGRGWNVHYIPNGVDPAQFSAPVERSTDRVTILVVNRDFSNGQKGYGMVRHALSMIEPAGNRVVLAGQNSAPAAADLSRRFECRDAGYVRDRDALARLFAEADIFLFASSAENFPSVILEAMASECCVVATPTGGVVEQIEHARSGLLATAIAGEALGETLLTALGDTGLRRKLGQAARDRVLAHFTEARMVRSYLDLFREVIDEN